MDLFFSHGNVQLTCYLSTYVLVVKPDNAVHLPVRNPGFVGEKKNLRLESLLFFLGVLTRPVGRGAL